MKTEVHKINLDGNKMELKVAIFDGKDGKEFKKLFDLWKKLNLGLKKYGRKVNIPEVISEGMFCVFTGSARFMKKIKGKGKVSFDTFDVKKGRTEQIKASSIEKDLTSFGPRSKWDDLYFLDFYNGGKLDGTFNIYKISNKLINLVKVNKNQTFKEQQKEKRRPRFSITEKIIKKRKLKPIAKNVKIW